MNKHSRLASIAALVATVHMAALPVVAQAQAAPAVGLTESQIAQAIKNINAKLAELGVQGQVTGATTEGANTIFQLQPNAGVSVETLQQQLVTAQNTIAATTVSGTPVNAIVVSHATAASWASGFGVAIAGAAGISLLPAVLAMGLLGIGIAGIGDDAAPPPPP
ncbi:MAG: hypothetical protein ACK5F5_08780, partial [Gammaproteobacteria bacterium]